MKNASTESIASCGTHSTCETEQGPSECVKVNHCLFLDSMPALPEEVLSHHPNYKGMFCNIPDDEVSAVNLYRLFCKAVMDRKGKGSNSADPFSSEESDEDEEKELIIDQLSAYAEAAMSREHRTHIYAVLVLHKFARLIRWDHSGAVVTEKFNYKTHPEILGEFFWRFAHMTDEAQGYDPTAQLVSPGTTLCRLMDKMAAEKLPHPFDYIRVAFQKSLDAKWLRYKLAVEDKERGTRYFLVGKPQYISSGLVDNGTRSYVAIDIEKEQFVHLKDQRRLTCDVMDNSEKEQDEKDDHPLRTGGPHLEGDILAYLNKMGVRNVPTALCHGDVVGQVTATQDVWKTIPRMPWNTTCSRYDPPSKLVHYRLVEKEVGQPLSEFKTSLELVKLISDCLIAHEDAANLACVLHHDVSPGNMIMYPVEVTNRKGVTKHLWTGLLNDWELSKPITKPGTVGVARREGRTNAWKFVSSAILDDKFRQLTIEDELESFFYVLVYYGVRYLKHNSKDVASFMLDFFDSYSFSNGEYSCGSTKRSAIHHGELKWPDCRDVFFTGEGSHPHPLNDLIATMSPWFQRRYRMIEFGKRLCTPSSNVQVPGEPPDNTETNEYVDVLTNEDIQDDDDDDSKAHEDNTNGDGDEMKSAKATSELKGHRAMRLLLRQAVRTANWPSADKIGDQLPRGYTSKRTRGSKDSDAATTGEKRRPEDVLADIYMRKRPRHA
ncbi:hypothetical protein A0H81_06300 [Grifola frondosa]|uniref:Fungal-type protein kinase domain-containing protein n=1 Tax=Grifola frondosa TaxID=5627 RepID=A0A1C7MBW3_GRIFR|nr:hypothetical protein A0H81_06300 [Grifola frondosa]